MRYGYSLSKPTQLYAVATRISNQANAFQTFGNAPITRHAVRRSGARRRSGRLGHRNDLLVLRTGRWASHARPGDIDTIAQPLRRNGGDRMRIAPESPLPMMVLPVSKRRTES